MAFTGTKRCNLLLLSLTTTAACVRPKGRLLNPLSSAIARRMTAMRSPIVDRRGTLRSMIAAGLGFGAAAFSSVSSASAEASPGNSSVPRKHTYPEEGQIKFVRLYTTDDGETHLKICHVNNLEKKESFGTVQYVRDLAGSSVTPTDITFTQQLGENPWHKAPNYQFVITLSGGWYVKTTDGDSVEMFAGDVLYQDDSKSNPKNGTHYSGTLGGRPCNQMVIAVKVNRKQQEELPLGDW